MTQDQRAARPAATGDHLIALRRAWEEDLLRDRKQDKAGTIYRPKNVYASRIRKCARAMALDCLHPEDDPFDRPLTLERFKQGNESERATIARLHAIAPFCDPPFQIVEEQHRFEVRDRDGELLVSGKMDARLKFADGAKPPCEIKSGRSYESCETVEDLARGIWSAGALDQLLSYLFADDKQPEPRWGLILIRRQSDFPVFIRVNLEEHLDRVEGFLRRARLAVDARHQRAELPPFLQDAGECRRCPHLGKSCTPPMDFGPGAQIITDPDLLSAAEVRERNRMARDEYELADKKLKGSLRGVNLGILGPYQVTGEWGPMTKYDIPEDVKAPFKRVDPKGRFTLQIERIP